jgi:hypothetical protein
MHLVNAAGRLTGPTVIKEGPIEEVPIIMTNEPVPAGYLPDRRPVGLDAGEAGEGTGVIERKPNVAALGLVELAERRERHYAAVLSAEPAHPVLALHVADVGCASIGFHPEQFLKVDGLALGLQLRGSLFRRLHQRELR